MGRKKQGRKCNFHFDKNSLSFCLGRWDTCSSQPSGRGNLHYLTTSMMHFPWPVQFSIVQAETMRRWIQLDAPTPGSRIGMDVFDKLASSSFSSSMSKSSSSSSTTISSSAADVLGPVLLVSPFSWIKNYRYTN